LAGTAALTISPIQALPTALGANPPDNGKFMVVVNLFGGNDGLNTVVPAHLQPYYDRRPTLALTTGLLDLDGRYMLNGNLASLKQLWDAGQMHVVNKVGYPNRNLSHFTSMNIYSYGVRDIGSNGDGRGWLGRFADAYCADPVEPLGVISVGTGRRRDFEADAGEALVLSSVDGFVFAPDTDFRTDHDLRMRVARTVLDRETPPEDGAALTVYATSRQAHELVDRVQAGVVGWTDPGTYPNTTLGRRMREVSRLLQGRTQFNTKVLYTGTGGFDTHSGQAGRHDSLMQQVDGALGAFVTDMQARGLWDDCIVVVISEFGRRNFENGSAGTDHGHGNCFLVAGGGVRGGLLTGELTAGDLNEDFPDFDYDFREIHSDLVENHLGVPAAPLFPETFTSTGDINLVA
jgi:uncharacterized protein (DUF1501 family)